MTRRVQAGLQMQGGHFIASFVKVIKTENSLYEGRQYTHTHAHTHDFFSLFLGVKSVFEVGPTSYETPCILCLWLNVRLLKLIRIIRCLLRGIGFKISRRYSRGMKSNVVRLSRGKQSDSIFNDGVADIICSRQPMEPESRYTLREVIVYLVTVHPTSTRNYTEEVFFERLFQAASN